MPTPAATDYEVRREIDTGLSDDDLFDILERVARDIERQYVDTDDPDAPQTIDDVFDNAGHRVDFEAVLAAYRIATGRDRRALTESSETFRVTYETTTVAGLSRQLQLLDPGDAFSPSGGVRRVGTRSVATVEQERPNPTDLDDN